MFTRRLVHDIIRETIPGQVNRHLSGSDPHDADFSQLLHWIHATLPLSVTPEDLVDQSGEIISAMLVDKACDACDAQVVGLPMEVLDQAQRQMVLVGIDRQWQQHLDDMDELREGVYLRAQGQKDPLVEYENEAYELFAALMDEIKLGALQSLLRSAAGLGAFLAQLHNPPSTRDKLTLNLPASPPPQATKAPRVLDIVFSTT